MTIEFCCPYCTVAIEVADQAAGSLGRCPRCAAKITIPRPAALGPPPASSLPSSSPPEVLGPEASPPKTFPPETSPPATPDGLPTPVAAVPLPEVSTAAPSSPLRQRLRRRRRVAWVVPAVFLLILVGVVSWLAWQLNVSGSLTGELAAVELDDVDLEPAIVPRDLFALPAKLRDEALQRLREQPLPLVSERMQVQFRGSEEGLVVSVARGVNTRWYRVDVRGHGRLAQFLVHEAAPLRERQSQSLAQAATDFLTDFHRSTEKPASAAITAYRDRLGLTALVRGLGFEVVAVVGANIYPCVYEEADGTLYFLLPPGVKQFTLKGRSHGDRSAVFPGQFTVKVRQAVPVLPKAPAATPPAKDAAADSPRG